MNKRIEPPMAPRRILSLWFPRLAAERMLRVEPRLAGRPLAVVAEARGVPVLASLSVTAEAAGLRRGMGLADARAIHPGLATRPADPVREAAFLAALRRWAGKFSPWVAEEGIEALMLDLTGCVHLFGGEAALVAGAEAEAADLGLSLRAGLAGTVGAAWAIARFSGARGGVTHAGDAIDQEARATRARARKRRWERGGTGPTVLAAAAPGRIAPPDDMRGHLEPLPVAALRLGGADVAALEALGLRRIGDLAALPRAQLARRAGREVMRRLDQATGRAPEPVSPARPDHVFALRLTLPEPIGLEADVLAGFDRLLGPLCARLETAGMGARILRATLIRADGAAESREIRLARPTARPGTVRPLLVLGLAGLDAGFGIDALRLEAVEAETVGPRQRRGRIDAAASAPAMPDGDGVMDLIGRLGARLGLESLTRLHPADSHIPEKGATVMAAAFSAPAPDWPSRGAARPIVIFPPEPLVPRDRATPPGTFVWRRRVRRRAASFGPERIAPEWWLDDPAWRSGPRDYWRVETGDGARLWIYEVRGGETATGWFAQGSLA